MSNTVKETHMSSRSIKSSTKLKDCITGDEIDNIIDKDNPVLHVQCDGHTNNITFDTPNTNAWKTVTLSYFRDNAEIIKENDVIEVIRVKFQDESNKEFIAKINLYKTGKINIQGAKCKVFERIYFKTLKELVEKESQSQNEDNSCLNLSSNQDDFSSFNTSSTLIKTVVQLTSTPVPTDKKQTLSPRERILNRKDTLDNKLDRIYNMLDIVSQSLSKLVDLITDIKRETGSNDNHIITSITQSIESQMKCVTKQMKEQLYLIEDKTKHNNTTIDSLHVKTNFLDSQSKKVVENQTSILAKMEKLERAVSANREQLEVLDNCVNLNTQIKELTESQTGIMHKVTQLETALKNNQESLHLTSIEMNEELNKSITHEKLNQKDSKPTKTKTIDNFIICDSILNRIDTRRFTRTDLTAKRYVRGGARLCHEYMEKSGQHINGLKRVLLSIGARDLHGDGVKESEFRDLFEIMSKSWPNTTIFVLPILKRKDMPDSNVEEANMKILNASKGFGNITVLRAFNPSNDMYFDAAHLNTTRGIPAMVKFLKVSMGITSSSMQRMPHMPSRPPHRMEKNQPPMQRMPPFPSFPPMPPMPPQGMEKNQLPMQRMPPVSHMPPFPPMPPMPPMSMFYPWMWGQYNPNH